MLHWIRHYDYNAPYAKKTNLCIPPLLLIPINVFILCLWQVLSLLLAVSRFLRGPQVCEKRYCLYGVWRHLISSSPPWPLSQRSKTLPRESQQTIHNCEVTRRHKHVRSWTQEAGERPPSITENTMAKKYDNNDRGKRRRWRTKEQLMDGSLYLSLDPRCPPSDRVWIKAACFSRINRFS